MKITVSTAIHKIDDLNTFKKSLKSVSFADEIRIYAMEMKGDKKFSKLTKEKRIKVLHTKRPKVIEEIRNKQIKDAHNDWVLILDFDEIVTPALKKEILHSIKSDGTSAYRIKRKNYSLGRRLRFGGWSDDFQIRLINKNQFKNWPKIIHATPEIEGSVKTLTSPLLHLKDANLETMVKKTNRYSDAEADLHYKAGSSSVSSFTLLRKFIMEIFRRAFIKLGLLDGAIGIIQSIYQGFSVFITYAKLYEKQTKEKKA